MHAWSLTALGDNRQYGGNLGYRDDPQRTYRYDSDVANSRRLAEGDLVFIRDRKYVTGIATVERITSRPSSKLRQRCPECKSVNIKERRTKTPRWRCVNDHAFSEPQRENVRVTAYEAEYGAAFHKVPSDIPVSHLKRAALRPNDQLAIEEVNPALLEAIFVSADSSLASVFITAAQAVRVLPDEGLHAADLESEPDTSAADTRNKVLRSIKMRRGQRKFRSGLARRYGSQCMISGCALFDVVEAAHIWPHQGEASNNLKNGLLLRADLHTLFDLDLLGIEPSSLAVRFHRDALRSGYSSLEGVTLGISKTLRPSKNVLEDRWRAFKKRSSSK